LVTIEELVVPLSKHGIIHELVAYVHLYNVIRICPFARAFSLKMEMDNSFHGYVYWYLVLDFLVYCVKTFGWHIPGLSTTDAVGTGLSSCDKVAKLATEKKAEMVASLEYRGVAVPNLNSWFYKPPGQAASLSVPHDEDQAPVDEDEDNLSHRTFGGEAEDGAAAD
jgi:hypothetical protein